MVNNTKNSKREVNIFLGVISFVFISSCVLLYFVSSGQAFSPPSKRTGWSPSSSIPGSSRISPTEETACLPGSLGYSGLVNCTQQSDCDKCIEKPQGEPMECVTVTGGNQMLQPESLNSSSKDATLFEPVTVDLYRPASGTCSGRGAADSKGDCTCESGYTHAKQDKTNCDVQQLIVSKPGSVCLPGYANKCDSYTSKTVLSNEGNGDGPQWSCECKYPGSGIFAQNVEGGTCDVVLACGNNVPQMNAPPGSAAVPMQFLTYDSTEVDENNRWKLREVFPNRLTSWDQTNVENCQVALQSSTVSVNDNRGKEDFTYTVYDRHDLADPTCKLSVLQSNKCTAMVMRGESASAGDGTEVAYVVRGSGRAGDPEKTRAWPPFPPLVQLGLQRCPDNWTGSGTTSDPCTSPTKQFKVSFFDDNGDWNGKYTSLRDMRNVGYSAENESSPPPDAKNCKSDNDCSKPSVCHKNVCVSPCVNGSCESGDQCTNGLCYTPTCEGVGLKKTLGSIPWNTVNKDCSGVPQCGENPDVSFYLNSLNYDKNSVTGYPLQTEFGGSIDCTSNMGTKADVPTCECTNCRDCEPCCCDQMSSTDPTCLSCDVDTPCAVPGTMCNNGICCVPDKNADKSSICQSCSSTEDCKVQGTYCINGVCCTGASPTCKTCTSASDCQSGEVCQNNVCCKHRFSGDISCTVEASPWECTTATCTANKDCKGKQNVCVNGKCCNKSAQAECASATGYRYSPWKGSRDGPVLNDKELPSFYKPELGTTMESWGAACTCDGWITTSNGSRAPLIPAYTLPGGREDPASWWQCVIDPCWSEESQLSRYNSETQKCECVGGLKSESSKNGVAVFSTIMDWEATGQTPTCVKDPCNPAGSRSTLLKGCGAGGGTCDPNLGGENVAATCVNNKCYAITTNSCKGLDDVNSCLRNMVGTATAKNITKCVKTFESTEPPVCNNSIACTTDSDCFADTTGIFNKCINGNCCETKDKYRCAVLDLSRENVTCSKNTDCALGTCLTHFGGSNEQGICSGGCVCPSSVSSSVDSGSSNSTVSCTKNSECNAGRCVIETGKSTGICIGMNQTKTDANPLQSVCIGPCAFNPCQNGGTCSVGSKGEAVCSCGPCYKGGENDPFCVEQKQGIGNYCSTDADCCEGVCRHAFWFFGSKKCRQPHWWN